MFKKVNSILLTFTTLRNLEKRFVYTNVTRAYAYIGVSFPRAIFVHVEFFNLILISFLEFGQIFRFQQIFSKCEHIYQKTNVTLPNCIVDYKLTGNAMPQLIMRFKRIFNVVVLGWCGVGPTHCAH